ncbi:MAG: serine protease [Chitinophagaceae bacterium]
MKNRSYILSFLGIIAGLFAAITAPAQDKVVSTEQNYAASSPAVVMVQTVFSATVYVNKVEMNERRFQLLVDSVKKLDTTGTMFTATEKLDIVVKALYNNPFRFFSGTREYFRQQHRIVSSGTGFFVSGDGYIVTNAHIIDRDNSFIRRKFILSTYQEVTDANIKSLQLSWAMTLTDEQRNLLNNAYSIIYSQVSSMIIFDLKKDIYVQYRMNNEDTRLSTARMPARVIIKGKPMPGKDVAILKVDSVKQVPTLPISKDSIPRIGEQVLVYGYPEPVTSNPYLAKETTIEPTLTAGVISAIKKSLRGWPVIQMDAVISHGSSGSPVCNNRGEVIGLATFGTLEQNTGVLASSYNFAIPISVVKEYLDSAKVEVKQSESSLAYRDGLEFFYNQFYGKALNKFKTVKKLNESYPQLYYYIDASNRKITSGEDRETFLQKSVFRVIALVLILGGIFIFYRWQWKARTVKGRLN